MIMLMRINDLIANNPSTCKNIKTTKDDLNSLEELELLVVSPLTRALQTFKIGLGSHISKDIPGMALPLASE